MAISLYDEAIYNKILKVVKDPNMKVLKPEETSELFGINADEKKDFFTIVNEYKQALRADESFDVVVAPSWRPDKAMNIEKPDFAEYISK